MPNRDAHLLAGGIVGGAAYVITRLLQKKEINLLSLLLSIGGGAIMGEAPDIIEPAANPNHRALAHSLVSGGAVVYGGTYVPNLDIDDDQKAVIIALAAGYLSHLILDSTTPKGLPLV